jgi:hypothetical protein
MLNSKKLLLASLVRRLSTELGDAYGATCAVDCLRQWEVGLFQETYDAWCGFLKSNIGKIEIGGLLTLRNGLWAPVIMKQKQKTRWAKKLIP